jgi:hypothetical protein
MRYFNDDYLQHLTETDRPYFQRLQETDESDLKLYILQLFKAKKAEPQSHFIFYNTKTKSISCIIFATDEALNQAHTYVNPQGAMKAGFNPEGPPKGREIVVGNGDRIIYYYDRSKTSDIRAYLESLGYKYNEKEMGRSDWLYADGSVKKAWGTSWGSEVMGSVANALSSQGNMSWVGTGKS